MAGELVVRLMVVIATAAVALGLGAAPASAFVTFESGQVRPLAISADGTRLFVCNTPDNRLEIYDISAGGQLHLGSVPVGLEPVAVAARTNGEVWVVNHLSDSVSIVDVSDVAHARVTRTLLVGDEPRDIVFGGSAFDHAFITTAHRGQNRPGDPQLTSAGIGRADVWVFDSGNLGTSLGGDEETIVTLFGDTPRPLAVSADGKRVYVGVFHSGNQTTTLSEGLIPNGGQAAGGLPLPNTNHAGLAGPETGLIVKFNGSQWIDQLDRDWSGSVRFSLPDYDVFALDADAHPPVQVAGTAGRFPHVGTVLFNMAIHPSNGKVYVSNLESFNEVRFEGPGTFAGSTVRGHIAESRISIIDPVAETVTRRHLNKHIDYDQCCDALPNDTNAKSLAFPLDMAFSGDGSRLFVSAFGSSKIGVFVPSELENDTFTPNAADQIEVSGGGPTGLVLDEAGSRLFVLTRFDNSISVVSTATGAETAHLALHNPEPRSVVEGRPFLYDARLTSSHGDQACASCHIFGDFDSLGWDLGNPDGDVVNNANPFAIPAFIDPDFHPMKGPMTTQSLRGMDNHGPMHWRGDRTGSATSGSSQPDRGAFNEQAAFKAFNPAFEGLVGRADLLTDEQMQKYTDFILQVMYPPNPNRQLDDSLTADQANAHDIYFNRTTDTLKTCNGCHVLDRNGNAASNVARPGFFGSDGRSSFENEPQIMKIPQLRNVYQKIGMFGMPATSFLNPGDNGDKGEQIRGFGVLHDGSIDTVFRFFQAVVFNPSAGNTGFLSDVERRQMESLVLAYDTNFFPIVGQQVSRDASSGPDVEARIDLLLARADAGDCDVVVKGVVAGEERGYLYGGAGQFESDRDADAMIADAQLRGLADVGGQELTFTAVPPGEGVRIGIDRDRDGFFDADEVDGGSDPADELSLPCVATTSSFVFKKASLVDPRGRLTLKATVTLAGYGGETVEVDAADGDGGIVDRAVSGGDFVVNSSGSTYKFKAARGATGIVKAVVKTSGSAGQYRLSVTMKDAWTAPAADREAAATTVTLNVGGVCFEGSATKVR